jgi:hypothetical protein
VEGIVTMSPDPRARLQPRRPHIRLTVTDTGSGIPPDKLRAIFEPFVQAESGHTRSREGSGLGLTIAQRLARAMGGDLTVESTEGEGSTFSLWLPAAASAAADVCGDDSSAASSATDAGTRRAARLPNAPHAALPEVANGLLSQLPALVKLVVERIRSDPMLRMAAGLRTSQVADHLSTLLADIANALVIVDEAEQEPTSLLADAMEIQRLVSERHGAQRARLGWTEAAMRREFMIIREELEGVVRRSVPPKQEPHEVAHAVATVSRFIDQAEYVSVRALEKARVD